MKSLNKIAASVALLAACVPAFAESEFQIDLSGDAVRGEFGFDVGVLPNNNAKWNFGALFADDVAGDDGIMIHTGLLVTGDAGAQDALVQAGLAVRAAAFDADNASGGAIAIGGEIDARLPEVNRIGVGVEAYFAPDASSFSDISGYFEYAFNVNYELIRNGFVYVGYRKIEVDVDDVDIEIDDGAHAGFRVRF